MKAIILAAGRGMRLKAITLQNPKCLLKIGNETIIDFQVAALRRFGINDVLIVLGYEAQKVKQATGKWKVRYAFYPNYIKTNNLHTLWHVRKELNQESVILFSDVLFDWPLLGRLLSSQKQFSLLVDRNSSLSGTMRVKIEGLLIKEIGNHISPYQGDGNFIGLFKASKQGWKILVQEMQQLVKGNFDQYYTKALDSLAKKAVPINFVDTHGYRWIEIDNKTDLARARKIRFIH